MLSTFLVVFVGSQDGTVHVWSAEKGHQVNILDGGHPGPTQCVQFNPRLMMLASACNSMVHFGCVCVHEEGVMCLMKG